MRINPLPLFVAFASLLTVSSNGQSVAIVDDAVWQEEYVLISGGLTEHHSYFELRTDGDTLMGGQHYVKIRQVGVDSVSTLGSSEPPVGIPIDRYIAAIRADEVALAWYVWFEGYPEELLLYDFDLSMGDVLAGTWGDCSAGSTVTNIDSILVAGAWHRRFFLSAPYRFIIEGVGGSSGLFGYLCQAFEEYGCLNTYAVPGDELIVDGCGSLSTGVNASRRASSDRSAYPNPTTAFVNFGPEVAYLPIIVLDRTGRIVDRLSLDANGSVDLSALSSGLYMVQCGSAVHRVMKY